MTPSALQCSADGVCELELLAGTYEQYVVGYRLQRASDGSLSLHQSLADHAHSASVRCVTSHKELAASGGADHVIRVFDLRRRHEVGMLVGHETTVTCVQFHAAGASVKLLSGDEEGRLLVSRVGGGGWRCQQLGRHQTGVTALAVHPGGLLALSASSDHRLLTWDLVRARCAYRTRLPAAASFVLWSPAGATFCVGLAGRCDVYSVSEARVLRSVEASRAMRRAVCAAYLTDSVLFVGGETGMCSLTDIAATADGAAAVEWRACSGRVRCGEAARRPSGDQWLATGSSTGVLALWRCPCSDEGGLLPPQLLARCDVGCRILCLTVCSPSESQLAEAAQLATAANELSRDDDSVNGHLSDDDASVSSTRAQNRENSDPQSPVTPSAGRPVLTGKQVTFKRIRKVATEKSNESAIVKDLHTNDAINVKRKKTGIKKQCVKKRKIPANSDNAS